MHINPHKCETILFHLPLRFVSNAIRKLINEFYINFKLDNNTVTKIEHKKIVKYLSIHLDYLFRLNNHIDIQLEKARSAYKKYRRLFFNKQLEPKAKIIFYTLLIRPILTYASPIWWNINAATMERIRKFERSCLRAALHMYRSPSSNYTHMYSNKELYKAANISRIDVFILDLTRNYYNNFTNINNKIVQSYKNIYTDWQEKAKTGYFPPHYFPSFDNAGLIQNSDNIPIIYHYSRHRANKTINYNIEDCTIPSTNMKYCISISPRDDSNFLRLS